MPSVLPFTSVPMKAERFHFWSRSDALACGMLRAMESMMAMVCSAAAMVLPVGALTTAMPRRVAASRSTLSTPTPARPHHLQSRAGLDDGGGDLRLAADDEGVGVGNGLEELPLGHAQPPLDGEPRLGFEDVHSILVDGISDEDLHVSHCLLRAASSQTVGRRATGPPK